MTQQERDQLARDIYEGATVLSGYSDGYTKPWAVLPDHLKQRWLRAADRANARMRQLGFVRETGRRAA